MTWTVRYRVRSGQMFEIFVEAKTKRAAFAIAQRHHVIPFEVIPGGTMPESGNVYPRPYSQVRTSFGNPKVSRWCQMKTVLLSAFGRKLVEEGKRHDR